MINPNMLAEPETIRKKRKSWSAIDDLLAIWHGRHGFYWTALMFFIAGAGFMFIAMAVLILWIISGNGEW